MRRHPKAPSAGSNMRRGNRPGRGIRGALATPGFSRRAKGTGAPTRLLLSALAACAFLLALGASPVLAFEPDFHVDPVSTITYTTAQVSGTVNPKDNDVFPYFQYTTDPSSGNWSDANFMGPFSAGSGANPVSEELTNLKAGTEYTLRLAAYSLPDFSQHWVSEPGDYVTFITAPIAAPLLTIDPASAITYTSAHASGSVDPLGTEQPFDASCRFDYATQAAFGAEGFANAPSVPCDTDPVTGTGATNVAADLNGLKPGTTYHLRIVATNAGGPKALEAPTFTTESVPLPAVTLDPVTTFTETSAHFSGTIDPEAPGSNPAASDVTWHFECSPECPKLKGGTIPAGADPETVEADTTGLEPNSAYEVTLVAENAAGSASDGPEPFNTGTVAPEVEPRTTTANNTSAVLHARLNPRNSATTYHFDYGTTGSYGHSTPEIAGGSGGKAHIVGAQIDGLAPDTTYHFRIVATSAGGTTTGPDRTLTTGPGFGEDRAYEMVSPSQKLGNDIMVEATRTRAATDGSALQFLSLGAFGDAKGTGITTEYMAVRGDDAWQTHSITPLHKPQGGEHGIFAFDPRFTGELSPDLDTGVYMSRTLLTGDPAVAGIQSLYLRHGLRDPGPGTYELLNHPLGPVFPYPSPNTGVGYYGASTDLSHLIFDSRPPLTPDAPAQPIHCELFHACEHVLYEHTPTGTRLVGKIPVAPATSCTGADCVAAPRSFPGRTEEVAIEYATDTISADGRRIFFATRESPFVTEGPLYMREDGTTTIQIDAPETETPLSGIAKFEAASSDGSKVFFISGEQLYRYDVDAPADHHLTRLSVNQTPGGDSGVVLGVYGASDDGSYVYFTDASQLVAGQPALLTGEVGLFSWHEGELAFVGVVSLDDEALNTPPVFSLNLRQSRVTPDGKHISFLSQSANQPTDETSGDCDGIPCRRLYVYSTGANDGEGKLACASCPPDGAPSSVEVQVVSRAGTGGAAVESHLNRAITDDGRLVFFSTAERLVPDDVNGRIDAYAYDTRTTQLHLISTGHANEDSYFLEATPDGSDVFFATRERLVGWDNDNLTDIYDARVGGGLPEPPPPSPSCQGDACQPPPVNATRPSLATSTSKGPGNVTPRHPDPSCPKGKRRAHSHGKVRCARKTRGRHPSHKNRANTDRRASR